MGGAGTWQKEQFSLAYIHALAARDGYTIGTWNVDKDGVDITLRLKGLSLDLQVKSTTRPRRTQRGLSFDLDVATYDKLRDNDRSAPGYLFVVPVPAEPEDWIHVTDDDHLLLRCNAYFAQIQNREEVSNAATAAIAIPWHHRVTTETLRAMFVHSRRHVSGLRDVEFVEGVLRGALADVG